MMGILMGGGAMPADYRDCGFVFLAVKPYLVEEVLPGPDVKTDADWLDYARERGGTVYHPVGTCRMGADQQAVVDERLRVRGVDGLRVIDASVMPRLVSTNTNAAAIMIGEKGAAMVLEDAQRRASSHALT